MVKSRIPFRMLIMSKRVQGDALKYIHFILPVMCDGTQKSACNIIRKASFVFTVRECNRRRENFVEPGWKFFINTAEIIPTTFVRGLLKLANLINKKSTKI